MLISLKKLGALLYIRRPPSPCACLKAIAHFTKQSVLDMFLAAEMLVFLNRVRAPLLHLS